jgi:hypothetical protein
MHACMGTAADCLQHHPTHASALLHNMHVPYTTACEAVPLLLRHGPTCPPGPPGAGWRWSCAPSWSGWRSAPGPCVHGCCACSWQFPLHIAVRQEGRDGCAVWALWWARGRPSSILRTHQLAATHTPSPPPPAQSLNHEVTQSLTPALARVSNLQQVQGILEGGHRHLMTP